MCGSRNLPGRRTGRKLESKTSIVPARKLVANKKAPDSLKPIASPLYTAPPAELFTAITAWVGSTLLFHPSIVPSSVAKISLLAPDLRPAEMTKPAVALVATPVGDDCPPSGAGTLTTRGDPGGRGCPSPP